MSKHAKDGAPLEEFVTIAVKYSLAAEQELPRAGPGAKPTVPDWVLAVMVAVGILLRKKAKNAQHIWWCSHREEFQRWFPGQHFPGRSTFYDRYRRIWILFQKAIELQGRDAVDKGWANAKVVAVDKSLIAGRGRPWAPRDRRRKHIPKRVDPDTTWSYSKHDSWVQGYSFETVVTAPARGICWPLAASCDTASRSEQKSCLSKFDRLPHQTTHVLADVGYDSNAVAESVERRDDGPRADVFSVRKFPDQTSGNHDKRNHARAASVSAIGSGGKSVGPTCIPPSAEGSMHVARQQSSRLTAT